MSSNEIRKPYPLKSRQEEFLEEGIKILNRVGRSYYYEKDKINFDYVNGSYDDEIEWYQKLGSDVIEKDGRSTVYVTEEFLENVGLFVGMSIPFRNVILMVRDDPRIVKPANFANPRLTKACFYASADPDFETILLSAEKKGSSIKYEDIRRVSWGSTISESRPIKSYTIRSSDNDILVLEIEFGPVIEDW